MAQCLPFYSYCSSLTTGCYLYTDIKRTATVGPGWVSDGTTSYQINFSGMIISTSNCVFNYRAYLLGSNGTTGTVYWKDCNGVTQSVYNTGASNWNYVVPCALEGSFTWTNPNGSSYLSIGFPCDCNNINACHSYTITSSRTGQATGSIWWVNCSGYLEVVNGLPNGQTMTLCARKGSVWNFSTNDGIGHIGSQGVTGYTGGGTRGIVDNGLCHPASGTYLYSQCVGCDLYAFRANGSGGSYQAEVLQYNTEACCTIGPGGGGGGGGGEIFQ
jgi:hypothetical protein